MSEKSVEFKVGKETLRGTMFVPSGKAPFPAVVFYHGSGSKRERYMPAAEALAKEGVLTLAFDFRGCGESDGIFEEQTHSDAIEDAKAGLDFLLSQNVDKERVGICGGSFGGYLAGYILPDYVIKSLVFRVPAAFSDRFLSSRIKRDNESKFFEDKNNWDTSSSYKNISKFKGPILILKAENDEMVPAEVVDAYYNRATSSIKKELRVIKGADHRFSGDLINQFYDLTKGWFLQTL